MVPVKIMICLLLVISIFICSSFTQAPNYKKKCNTNSLASPEKGTLYQGHPASEQIYYYNCLKGYELIGTNKQTCINGTWSPSRPPICRRRSQDACAMNHKISNGRIQLHAENRGYQRVPKGTTATVICDAAYSIANTFQVQFVIKCGPSGMWTTLEGLKDLNRCTTRSGCPPPPEVPQAMFRYNSLSPSMGESVQVEYICSTGYMLLDPGDATLTCHNGQWEGPIPTCEPKTACDAPGFIRHGKWSVLSKDKSSMTSYADADSDIGYSKFNVGTKLRYSCSPGYKLEGPGILQCTSRQIWSRAPPNCIPKSEQTSYCPSFGAINNGFCKCMGQDAADLNFCMPFHHGTRIQCSCLLGYTLKGESVLTCTRGSNRNIGMWDWDVPTCSKPKRYEPDSEGENDIGMLPDGQGGDGHNTGYNSGDIRDSKTKVSSLVIVVTTACSVLGILVLIMVVVIFRRKKPRATIFQQGSTPPPYARVHNTTMDEHDRLALMAYADASRIHLPSYEEAMRVGGHIGMGGRGGPSIMDRSVSPTASEYQRLPNVLVRSNMHHPNLAGDGNNNINNNNANNSNRHSTITTSTMNRDGLSEIFGSVDTVNVSMSDASTAVTVETFDSGTSNRSMNSQRANAGSLNSFQDHLSNNDDAPLLDTSPHQREMDVVSLSSNPSRTSKEE